MPLTTPAARRDPLRAFEPVERVINAIDESVFGSQPVLLDKDFPTNYKLLQLCAAKHMVPYNIDFPIRLLLWCLAVGQRTSLRLCEFSEENLVRDKEYETAYGKSRRRIRTHEGPLPSTFFHRGTPYR